MAREIEVSDPWFTHPVEGRKNLPRWSKLAPEDREILFMIKRVSRYPSLNQYLLQEGLRATLPGVTTLEEARKIYYQWSTPEQIEVAPLLN